MKLLYSSLAVAVLLTFACTTTQTLSSAKNKTLAKVIKAHGGKLYDSANIAFTFRKKAYSIKNNQGKYTYSSTYTKDGKAFFDQLTNDGFTRKINGVSQNLSVADATKFGNSLNSVIYFAQLPYKLDDPAARKMDKGKTTIKGLPYKVVEVSFAEEGGGTDHDDVFYYWINQKTNIIDYLAYKFHVDKGGVRFRSAYNPRKVGGIHFQDYVNFKADKDTPLATLPTLYEQGKLKELSKIELEKVRVLE